MAIDLATLHKVAHLARLELPEGSEAKYLQNMADILTLVEQMNAVDTDNVAPMAHPLDLTQPLREDVVTEVDEREVFQSIAPATEAGLYLVPKVIETEEEGS